MTDASGAVIGIHAREGDDARRTVASIVAESPQLYVEAAPVPEGDQKALAVATAAVAGYSDAPSEPIRWEDLLLWMWEQGVRSIVFDGLGRLLEGNRRFLEEVGEAWARMTEDSAAPTLIFVDEDREVLDRLTGERSPFLDLLTRMGVEGPPIAPEILRAEPPGFDAVARRCSGWSADDVFAAYAIFGGGSRRLAALDPAARLSDNVIRLVLTPDAPLFSSPLHRVERLFQSPARYVAVMKALAGDAMTWKDLRQRLHALDGAGPLGPYLNRLAALDLVDVRTSLDAAPGGRRRRYALADPLDGFWWRFVLPLRSALLAGTLRPEAAWRTRIEPELHRHVSQLLPRICREFVAAYGLGTPGTEAREIGALWGDGYDLPVAGKLGSGPIVYGDCHWHERRPTEAWLDRIDEQLRNTRYGFGREARLRVLFTRVPPAEGLRQRLLRSDLARRIGPSEMVAAARARSPGVGGGDSAERPA